MLTLTALKWSKRILRVLQALNPDATDPEGEWWAKTHSPFSFSEPFKRHCLKPNANFRMKVRVVPWLNWIEQPPPKGQVTGSSPVGITIPLSCWLDRQFPAATGVGRAEQGLRENFVFNDSKHPRLRSKINAEV